MSNELRITFRHMDHSNALESRVRKLAGGLERRSSAMQSCSVVLEGTSAHGRGGGRYVVRLELKVPGGEIIVNQDGHEDVFAVLQQAFAVASRQLSDYERRRRQARVRQTGDRAVGRPE